MISTMKTAALAGVLALAAGSASATTLSVGETYTSSDYEGQLTLMGGTTLSIQFMAGEKLDISSFLITGSNEEDAVESDLSKLLFGITQNDEPVFVPQPTTTYSSYIFGGSLLSGEGSLEGGTFENEDVFYITFDGRQFTTGESINVDFEFTTAMAAVPVPAAGLMLLTALVGGGVAARARKKKA